MQAVQGSEKERRRDKRRDLTTDINGFEAFPQLESELHRLADAHYHYKAQSLPSSSSSSNTFSIHIG